MRVWGPSETLAQPLSDAGEMAARAIHQIPPAAAGFEILKMRGLRINQQAGRRGKSRAPGRIRQSGDTQRPADAHRPSQDTCGEFRQSGQLAGAAGEDHAPTRFGSKRRSVEAVAYHFQDFLDPRPDDLNERRAAPELR